MFKRSDKIATLFIILLCLSGCITSPGIRNQEYPKKVLKLTPAMRSKVNYILHRVNKHFPEYNWVIHVAYRSAEEQARLYQIGRRGIAGEKIVTSSSNSKHSLGMAVDIYPKKSKGGKILEYYEAQAAYNYYGQLAKKIGLRWGGDWNEPKDYGHIELNTK